MLPALYDWEFHPDISHITAMPDIFDNHSVCLQASSYGSWQVKSLTGVLACLSANSDWSTGCAALYIHLILLTLGYATRNAQHAMRYASAPTKRSSVSQNSCNLKWMQTSRITPFSKERGVDMAKLILGAPSIVEMQLESASKRCKLFCLMPTFEGFCWLFASFGTVVFKLGIIGCFCLGMTIEMRRTRSQIIVYEERHWLEHMNSSVQVQ